jgi:hypothetical protein
MELERLYNMAGGQLEVVAKRAGGKLCTADGGEYCFVFCVAILFKKVEPCPP